MKSKILSIISIFFLLLSSLACEMTSPIAAIFATDTPTPTITPSQTPTPTITPTPTFTLTPTPLPTGVQFETQDDKSIILVDYDNKFQLTIPKGWIAIPMTMDDLSEVFDRAAEANPELAESLTALQNLDSDVIRMVALNEDPKYIQNGFSSNLTITAFEDKLMSTMPLAFVTGMLEGSLEGNGAKVLTSGANITKSADGIEIGIIESEQSVATASGSKVVAYSKYLIFQAGGKVIMLQLATPTQFSEELGTILDEIAKTIKVLD